MKHVELSLSDGQLLEIHYLKVVEIIEEDKSYNPIDEVMEYYTYPAYYLLLTKEEFSKLWDIPELRKCLITKLDENYKPMYLMGEHWFYLEDYVLEYLFNHQK